MKVHQHHLNTVSILVLMDLSFRPDCSHCERGGKNVSILVLMDLSFRPDCSHCERGGKNVSILVLMDLSFRPSFKRCTNIHKRVSILVLMDLSFRLLLKSWMLWLEFVSILVLMDLSFRRGTMRATAFDGIGFNPCFNGFIFQTATDPMNSCVNPVDFDGFAHHSHGIGNLFVDI